MIDISLNKVSINFGFGNVLKDVSLEIKQGEVFCIIGPNGGGKSTILNLIMGIEKPSSGTISIRKNATIGYLNQNTTSVDSDKKVKDILYQSLENILKMEELLKNYEQKMALANERELDKLILKYTNLQEQFINLGGYEINSRIEKIVAGFKIGALLEKNYNTLSGGEKRIVSFAAIMIKNPDILLLDEPTNHLDIDTLEWLEKYLNNYKGTIILVSHDRYFLNKIAKKIGYLDRGKLDFYFGNYAYFEEEYEKRLMLEFKNYKDQQKIIEAMKRKIKQLQEYGRLAGPSSGEEFFKRAASIQKRLDKMDKLERPKPKTNLPLNLNMNTRSGNDALTITNLNIQFANKAILENVNLKIKYQDHICLLGNNGSGKTSLIKEILNNNPAVRLGANLKIGYIAQEIVFEEGKTIYEVARQNYVGEESHLRSALNKFIFSKDTIFKQVQKLSGGEKVRLKLFCLMQKDINFLILDEPTNHIDIATREILEDTLADFPGTILFVSHDRAFINKLANKIVVIENHQLIEYQGNYEDYKEYKKVIFDAKCKM